MEVYQIKPGPTATLIVDLPSSYRQSALIVAYDDTASEERKSWDNAASLVYGEDQPELFIKLQQFNTHIPISANKPFHFTATYQPGSSINCQLTTSFVPVRNQVYRLTGGMTNPTNVNKSFLEVMSTGIDWGGCYVIVEKMEHGKWAPIKLK